MEFTYSSVVDAAVGEVSAWHARPGADIRLTPPWPPSWLAEGLPAVLPWRHTREFTAAGEHATLVTDVVATPLPAQVLRPAYAYRHRQLADDLAAQARARALCPDTLTIAVTGSGGLIGTALTALLTTAGHRVIRLVRRPPRDPQERQWRPEDPGPGLLAGVDAVIHLAGASIGGRFTPARKREIRDSRVLPTRRLAELAASAPTTATTAATATAPTTAGAAGPTGLRAFVSASAIGIYGPDRGDEVLTEASRRGDGFLADVVADWEDATAPAAAAGIRTVQVRTGIVQTPRGGMLRLLTPLFEAGLGGRLGSGKQWLAWIGLDDVLDIYLRAVADPGLSGPVNAVAPEPVRNVDYTRILAGVLRRPAVLPVPGLGPRLLLGDEGAREIAQASQCVVPERLIAAGHQFRYPQLDAALRHMFGRSGA
ncbi:MAG: TIGR01777 family oxidoreductase [Actinobacteria bacterium]|nr:TIGR01777 family oxidoreductase [Actinomycetota bacterium]